MGQTICPNIEHEWEMLMEHLFHLVANRDQRYVRQETAKKLRYGSVWAEMGQPCLVRFTTVHPGNREPQVLGELKLEIATGDEEKAWCWGLEGIFYSTRDEMAEVILQKLREISQMES